MMKKLLIILSVLLLVACDDEDKEEEGLAVEDLAAATYDFFNTLNNVMNLETYSNNISLNNGENGVMLFWSHDVLPTIDTLECINITNPNTAYDAFEMYRLGDEGRKEKTYRGIVGNNHYSENDAFVCTRNTYRCVGIPNDGTDDKHFLNLGHVDVYDNNFDVSEVFENCHITQFCSDVEAGEICYNGDAFIEKL